ncbi:hypothetical protein SPSIL_039120 [Sporomusa silvacetica DSM 10669]|uniref:Peptidase C1A papain C-terminal domain-containing protein n=1 Tax=Sporomusa silvacetica DSM 10669 TaxID=1123289 RepID=A0ABZ3IQN1_9FIRM|nr:papain family cysteine protease [Sporomusa silvacetica DSM 10669]
MLGLVNRLTLTDSKRLVHTGWLLPLPDLRDYSPKHPDVITVTRKLRLPEDRSDTLPDKVDLKSLFPPVEDQGNLGSCTANAAAGVIEYCEQRAFGKYNEASRLFIYKTTRNLMRSTGDSGAWLRTTMGAIALCGVAPEEYWGYTDKAPDFDIEPPPFVYSIANKYTAIKYFCHDPITARPDTDTVLNSIRSYIAAGVPAMFGFYGFPSFEHTDIPGGIPFPCNGESPQWGHAIVAVGYDDSIQIKNTTCNQISQGALLIRNSWGPNWGDNGYGWLPYDYIHYGLASDFWSLLTMEWVDTGQFGL